MFILTNRLTIRPISLADLDHVHELHSLAETDEYNTLGIPDSLQTTEKIVAEWVEAQTKTPQTSYVFCIEHTDKKQFIGLVALNIGKPNFHVAEVWYKLHVKHWRQGYATEALTKLLDFGFNDLSLHRIEAGCAVENKASSNVLEKVGMTKEGMKRQNLPIRGEWKDSYFYAILEEDFAASQMLG